MRTGRHRDALGEDAPCRLHVRSEMLGSGGPARRDAARPAMVGGVHSRVMGAMVYVQHELADRIIDMLSC